jgi:hypothetical protein
MLLTLLGTVTIAGHSTSAAAGDAAYERSPAPAPLEGSWVVTIRPIVCAGPTAGSDVPGIPPVTSHLTFGRGGALVESTSNLNLGAGKRTSGHGWWERTGQTSFQFAFQAFLLEPTAPYRTGLQRIEQTVELHNDYEWSSAGPVQFFETFNLDTTSNLAPYRAGCARANGVRMR